MNSQEFSAEDDRRGLGELEPFLCGLGWNFFVVANDIAICSCKYTLDHGKSIVKYLIEMLNSKTFKLFFVLQEYLQNYIN